MGLIVLKGSYLILGALGIIIGAFLKDEQVAKMCIRSWEEVVNIKGFIKHHKKSMLVLGIYSIFVCIFITFRNSIDMVGLLNLPMVIIVLYCNGVKKKYFLRH